MEEALLDAYRRTAFGADTPVGPLSLRIGQRSVELDDLLAAHGVMTWAYVTAFNPESRPLPPEANAARQRELEGILAGRGLVSYAGEGIADDGSWAPESSLLILGIARADAVRLGQQFGQLAIVGGELGGEAELIVCDPRRGS